MTRARAKTGWWWQLVPVYMLFCALNVPCARHQMAAIKYCLLFLMSTLGYIHYTCYSWLYTIYEHFAYWWKGINGDHIRPCIDKNWCACSLSFVGGKRRRYMHTVSITWQRIIMVIVSTCEKCHYKENMANAGLVCDENGRCFLVKFGVRKEDANDTEYWWVFVYLWVFVCNDFCCFRIEEMFIIFVIALYISKYLFQN